MSWELLFYKKIGLILQFKLRNDNFKLMEKNFKNRSISKQGNSRWKITVQFQSAKWNEREH